MKKKMIAMMICLRIYWNIIYDYIKPFLNWRFLISFFFAWMITNGWAYLFMIIGGALKIKWMLAVGTSYQTFLWLPCTPEKLVTIPIAIFIHKKLFPKDFKNINTLNNLLKNAKKTNNNIVIKR